MERFPTKIPPAMGSVDAEHTATDSCPIQGVRITSGHGHRTSGQNKRRGRPVTKTTTTKDTSTGISASGLHKGPRQTWERCGIKRRGQNLTRGARWSDTDKSGRRGTGSNDHDGKLHRSNDMVKNSERKGGRQGNRYWDRPHRFPNPMHKAFSRSEVLISKEGSFKFPSLSVCIGEGDGQDMKEEETKDDMEGSNGDIGSNRFFPFSFVFLFDYCSEVGVVSENFNLWVVWFSIKPVTDILVRTPLISSTNCH